MRYLLTAAICLVVPTTAVAASAIRGLVWAGDQPVPNAVVWLETPDFILVPSSPAIAQPPAVLDQRNVSFAPLVLAVRVGTTVEFPNNDRVFHNVFSFRDGKRFDLGLYPIGAVKRVTFDKPGLSRIFCNIHPRMAAYIMVVDSPYFAVSDEAGYFALPELPEGTYTYHAWRAGSEILSGSAVIAPGKVLEIRWP